MIGNVKAVSHQKWYELNVEIQSADIAQLFQYQTLKKINHAN